MAYQDQNLGSTQIMAQAPPLSAFIPDPSLLPPSGDPYTEVTRLLTQLQQQQPVTAPQPNKLETILTALAQGAAVAASNDPGAALNNQINTRLQMKQEANIAERTRQNQLQVAMIQGALDKARGIQSEQALARKEGREFAYRGAEGQLKIEEQKQLDLNRLEVAQLEAIQNNDLANRFARDSANRTKLESMAKAAPDFFTEGNKMRALIETLVPDIPREISDSISKRMSGQLPPNYTPQENEWYARFVTARNEDWKQDKDLARRVKESEITQNQAQAEYYRNSKIQDKYMNALQTNLGNAMADSIDSQYFRGKDGKIYSDKQLKAMPQIQQIMISPTPLTPEENLMEMKKNVEKQKTFQGEVINNNTITTPMPGQPTTKPTPQDAYNQFKAKGRTDEQIRIAMQANQYTEQEINSVINQQPTQSIKEMENTVKFLENKMKDTSYGGMSNRADTESRLNYARQQLEKAKKQAGIK